MNSKPLHLVNLDGLMEDGGTAPSLNIILQLPDIGEAGKEIQHG